MMLCPNACRRSFPSRHLLNQHVKSCNGAAAAAVTVVDAASEVVCAACSRTHPRGSGGRNAHAAVCDQRNYAAAASSSSAVAAPAAAAVPVDLDEDASLAGGFDDGLDEADDLFPLVAAPAAAVAPRAPTPPPPPPPPPPDTTVEFQRFRLFLANWALQHHISAAAITQLLQFLLSLFLTLGLLLPKRHGQPPKAAIAAAAAAAPRDVQLKPAAEQVWPRTSDKLVESVVTKEALTVSCYALCPNDRCGKVILLDRSRKLTAGQRCDRPLKDITERPLVPLPEGAAAGPASAPAASKAKVGQLCHTLLTQSTSTEFAHGRRPKLVFTYRSLHDSLRLLLQRPGLEKKCELWRQRYDPVTHKRKQTDLLSDIWDGEMWERYQHTPMDLMGPPPPAPPPPPPAAAEAPVRMDIDGEEKQEAAAPALAAAAAAPPAALPLLSQSGTLALGFNLDWYQPFDSQVYSMGGLYMVILNLPREERYLTENMIQVGILPGPGETPRRQLQGALKKLRDELLQLYAAGGVPMKTADHPDGRPVRAFLLHVVCDIPAARILCGFARETSAWGCPYCAQRQLKRKGCNHADWRPWTRPCEKGRRKQLEVEDFEERARFPRRTHQQHVEHARAWSKASVGAADSASSIETAQVKAFKEHGARWSWLLDLPYWDSIRCMPIDVMHNILLGTCKHIMVMMTGHKRQPKKSKEERAAEKQKKEEERQQREAEEAQAMVDRARHMAEIDRKQKQAEQQSAERAARLARRKPRDDLASEAKQDPEEEERKQPAAIVEDAEDTEQEEEDEVEDEVAQPDSEDTSGDDDDEALVEHFVPPAFDASPEDEKNEEEEKEEEVPAAKGKKKRSAAASAAAASHCKRPKQSGAAAASASSSAASVAVPILSKADLKWMQSFLNATQCPRDVGRIPRKLESLSQIKASEWMNFFGIFAVPIIRELMRDGHERLTMNHLNIFILMQLIVTKLREYAITPADIETLHEQLFEVTQLVAAAFPTDDGSITPNMHLSLHLRQQLLDYGPAASCWTAPYERINGLLGRFPLNRAMPAESTAARANKMVAAAGACYQEPEIVRFVGGARFEAPQKNGAAPTSDDTWLRTKHGGVHMRYKWNDHKAFQQFQHRRQGVLGAVEAHEAFPGCLRMCTHRSKPRTVHLKKNNEIVHGTPLSLEQGHKHRKGREPSQAQIDQLVSVSHVVTCLHAHYLETRKEDILALVDADDTLSEEEQATEKESLQDTSSTETIRQKALVHPRVLQFFDTLKPTVRMYDTLVMGSETYGSRIGRNHRSSFVVVAFPEEEQKEGVPFEPVLWYGQVSYYISHQYGDVAHFFAVCQWFMWPKQKTAKIHARTAMRDFYRSIAPSRHCQGSFAAFPVLTTDFHPAHAQDVVPVQSISHRWIPGKIAARHEGSARAAGKAAKVSAKTNSRLQLAYPVPTRVHA